MRHFLLYAVIRLGLWALIWWLLTLLDVGVMLAGVLAALIAMLISILFLDRLRNAAAMRWKAADERRAERREKDVDEDAEFEDSLLDGEETSEPSEPSEPSETAETAETAEPGAKDAENGPTSVPEFGEREDDAR